MSSLSIDKVDSTEDRSLPVFAEFDELLERIRERAFLRFRQRGSHDGFEFDDWLAAEREVCWPAAQLEEEDDEFEIKLALAGFKPEEISITATPREIIVRAHHAAKRKKKGKDDDKEIRWSEFRSNDVYRRIQLPLPIDVDRVEAELERGMLEIEAPKARAATRKPRKVDISSAA